MKMVCNISLFHFFFQKSFFFFPVNIILFLDLGCEAKLTAIVSFWYLLVLVFTVLVSTKYLLQRRRLTENDFFEVALVVPKTGVSPSL